MKPGHVRRARGFTLLEVVIALALLTLLVSVVYGGFSTAVRAYESAGERGDASARMRIISDYLRRSVGSAFPLAIASDSDWELVFEGTRERVRYVADLPTWVGIGGLHDVVIEVRREGAGDALLMRRRPLAVDSRGDLTGDYEDHVLLDEVSALSLRYYGSTDPRSAPAWYDEWSMGRSMPMLVELRVTGAGGESWPPVLVHPRVDTVRYQSVASPGTEVGAPPSAPGDQLPAAEQQPGAAAPGTSR